MSFSINDKFVIEAATTSSRLDGNLELKNSLTFRDEENVVSLNSFTVPNNIGVSNIVVTGSGYNYTKTPMYITSQPDNQLLFQLYNTSNVTASVPILNNRVTLVAGSNSSAHTLVRYNSNNLMVLGSNVLIGNENGKNRLVQKALSSNVFIFKSVETGESYFRKDNIYYNVSGGVFTDLDVSSSNYILSGYYKQDFGNVHLNSKVGLNDAWTVHTSNVLPLTNFQYNPFVLTVKDNGTYGWGKCVVGILNNEVATLDSKILVENGKVYFCSYVRSEGQVVNIVRYNGGTFPVEATVAGTTLNDTKLLVLMLIDGTSGSLDRVGHILLYGSSLGFVNDFTKFYEWSYGGNGEAVLYLRNDSSSGYRIYNSDSSYITALGIKNVLLRFSNQLKVKWYAPVISANSGLMRATQRYNANYTLIASINSASIDVPIYNADKSVFNTINSIAGYNTVIGYIIYDNLGNVHNLAYTRYINGGNSFNLGENFLGIFYNNVNIEQLLTDPYLNDTKLTLTNQTMNIGLFQNTNNTLFKILKVGDGIDKVIVDSVALQVTGSITLDSSSAAKLYVTTNNLGNVHYPLFTGGASSNEYVFNNTAFTFIPNTGNLGIGTTSPIAKLDVRGPVYATGLVQNTSGGYRFPDGTTQTTAATLVNSSVGVTFKTTILSGAELGGTTVSNNTTTYVTVVSYNYTPVSASSYLIIEFYCRNFISGSSGDTFDTRMTVNAGEIAYTQWNNDGRGSPLTPFLGRYTNSSTTAKTINIQAKRASSDDTVYYYAGESGCYLKITEIGR